MKLYLFILAAFMTGCQAQTKENKNPSIQEDTIMINKDSVKIEYYDFRTTQYGTQSVAYKRDDGWLVDVLAMENIEGKKVGACKEYAPASEFYMIYKEYYQNGMIKMRVKFMSGVPFGKREYFDEMGNCIKIIDEDKKLGIIKKEDVVDILEEEGWFNRRTGENTITNDTILPTDYIFYHRILRYMEVTFKRAVKDSNGNETEPPKWFIRIEPRNGMYITRYIIDGNTGKFEKKKTFEPRDE